jgi:hypothetical protein
VSQAQYPARPLCKPFHTSHGDSSYLIKSVIPLNYTSFLYALIATTSARSTNSHH